VIFLDNASTTPIDPQVLELLSQSLAEDFYNPHSHFKKSRSLLKQIEESQKIILEELGLSQSHQLFFTSGATESNHWVIDSLQCQLKKIFFSKADHVSTYAKIENSQLLNCAVELSLDAGLYCSRHITEICQEIATSPRMEQSPSTLFLLNVVNSQSGKRQMSEAMLEQLGQLGDRVFVHLDATQIILNDENLVNLKNADSLSLSFHKFNGPKGIGALIVKKKWIEQKKIKPMFFGHARNNLNLRAGTYNAPLIFAATKAISSHREFIKNNPTHFKNLSALLKNELSNLMSEEIFFPWDISSKDHDGKIASIVLRHYPSDVLLRLLEEENIFISSTSACSPRIQDNNPVFQSLGLDLKWHKNILRISFSRSTSENDIQAFIQTFQKILQRLKILKK